MVDIYGDSGDNSLIGRSENSGGEAHNVFGGAGNDTISGGGTGEHNLFGGDDNDILTGTNGRLYNDALTGGNGADTFIIQGQMSSDPLNQSDIEIKSENAVEILDFSNEDSITFGSFENVYVDNFYTVHYGAGDNVATFIHDERSGEIVASIVGDSYELPPIGSREFF